MPTVTKRVQRLRLRFARFGATQRVPTRLPAVDLAIVIFTLAASERAKRKRVPIGVRRRPTRRTAKRLLVSDSLATDAARVSTVKVPKAGVASRLPAASRARTSKVCRPSASAAPVKGEVQGANACASMWHSNVAPASDEKATFMWQAARLCGERTGLSQRTYDSTVSHRPDIDPYAGLPGADLVAEGVRDLAAGVESVPALLVSAAASRLNAVGLEVAVPYGREPAHRLYDLLAADDPRTAHSRYNALVGRLASFARAAERATTR